MQQFQSRKLGSGRKRVSYWVRSFHVAFTVVMISIFIIIPFANRDPEESISCYSLNITDKGPPFHFSLSGKKGAN